MGKLFYNIWCTIYHKERYVYMYLRPNMFFTFHRLLFILSAPIPKSIIPMLTILLLMITKYYTTSLFSVPLLTISIAILLLSLRMPYIAISSSHIPYIYIHKNSPKHLYLSNLYLSNLYPINLYPRNLYLNQSYLC